MLYELDIQRQIFAKYFYELTAYPLKIIYLTVTLSECSQEGFFFFQKKKKYHCFLITSDEKKGSCRFLLPLDC